MVESKNKKRDRNIAGTSNDNVTEHPDLKDLRSAILQSFKYRGKNAENLPILVFLRKWKGKKLEKGWARVLVSGSLLSPKSKNHLSEHERNIVGYIGAILSATRISTWADEVAFAFGTVGNTVRNAMEQHCENVVVSAQLKDTYCIMISDPPHLAPQLLQTPIQEVKRMQAKIANNVPIHADDPHSHTESPTTGDPSESFEPMVLFAEREEPFQTPPQTKAPRSSAHGSDEHRRETFIQRIISSVRKSAASASKSLLWSAKKAGRHIRKSKIIESPAEIICAIATIRDYLAQAEAIDPNVMSLAVQACELAKKEADGSVFEVQFTAPNGKTTKKERYAEIPIPCKSITMVKQESLDRKTRERAEFVLEILLKLCGVEDKDQKSILKNLVEQKFQGVLQWDAYLLDVEDCIAI